jgi:hypothetical protein
LYHFSFDGGAYDAPIRKNNEIEMLFCNKDKETKEIKNKIKLKLGRRGAVD